MIAPGDSRWNAALRDAPDVYEVHTIYKRVPTGPDGKTWKQIVIGRKVVANGVTLFSEQDY